MVEEVFREELLRKLKLKLRTTVVFSKWKYIAAIMEAVVGELLL